MSFRSDIDEITPGLRRYARALVLEEHDGRTELADSLVQQTILGAIPHEREIKDGSLRNWLYATLNEINDVRLRRLVAQGRASTPAAGSAHGISEALETLEVGDRAALLLVTLEAFSYSEAADILRVSRAALLQRLVRARNQLSLSFETSAAGDGRRTGQHPHLRVVK